MKPGLTPDLYGYPGPRRQPARKSLVPMPSDRRSTPHWPRRGDGVRSYHCLYQVGCSARTVIYGTARVGTSRVPAVRTSMSGVIVSIRDIHHAMGDGLRGAARRARCNGNGAPRGVRHISRRGRHGARRRGWGEEGLLSTRSCARSRRATSTCRRRLCR